ncbi:family 1 glycosylhydrolase [Bifidobacterium simiarum]|uniref:family 1 glycosylhydrolase n=1 Tax=Bifidobacterium simiarum TaxID=2045441 RepID=UPI001BDD861A|nr:family 1 glycosylhydrolase [Bifidobacterium simiarum]MBT1166345.1 glycoside hydrolase family 1 protein [Bifidobacterium simiarum]
MTTTAHASQGTRRPDHFLWGASTAGHQVDGNDTNADTTFLEHVTPSVFKVPADAACNSWEQWEDDLDLIKSFGLNAYRFSVEWSRIEPEHGHVDESALDHYDRVVDGCLERGIAPAVTLCHFTAPHWFAKEGAWFNPQAPDWFTEQCSRVISRLGDRIALAVTFNEPNLPHILAAGGLPQEAIDLQRLCLDAASRKAGVARYRTGNVAIPEEFDELEEGFKKAHRAAVAAVRAERSDLPVGLSLSVIDDTYATERGKELCETKRAACYGTWVDAVQGDDFIGVQNYEQLVYGDDGIIPPAPGVPVNGMGTEVKPLSLVGSVEYIHELTGLPVVVTEHGISTDDDELRCRFIRESVPPLIDMVRRGVPVLGYFHWTLLDNFEWISGYDSKLGLCSVNRESGNFERTPKPSAGVYRDLVASVVL